jgi:hypothetical protein
MNLYRLLADTVVAVHLTYVAFVVVGMAAILVGIVLRWSWVRNFWFRTVHLLMIGIVAVESLCGVRCPLPKTLSATETTERGHSFIFPVLPSCFDRFALPDVQFASSTSLG